MKLLFRVAESKPWLDGGVHVVLGAVTEGQQDQPHSNSNLSLLFPASHRKEAEPWMLAVGQEVEVTVTLPKKAG